MFYLGIDVSKATLDCCLLYQGVGGKKKNKPTLSGKKASATPPSFRSELVELARKSNI